MKVETQVGIALLMSGYLLGCFIMDEAHTLGRKSGKERRTPQDRNRFARDFFYNHMQSDTSEEVKAYFKRFPDPKVAAMRLMMSPDGSPEEREQIRKALASWYTKNL